MKSAIRKFKKEQWKKLLEELNSDIWGQGYRIVTNKCRKAGLNYKIPTKRRRAIVRELFPTKDDRTPNIRGTIEEPDPFTEGELREAARAMKSGKAPGPDGVSVEAVKIAVETVPDKMLRMYNNLLK